MLGLYFVNRLKHILFFKPMKLNFLIFFIPYLFLAMQIYF